MNIDHALEKVGPQFSVTRERIRQIEEAKRSLDEWAPASPVGWTASIWRLTSRWMLMFEMQEAASISEQS
jgi:hypothetical protein